MTEALARWAGRRILVVGDVMLDEHVRGEVDRISPEAPVPVVRVQDTAFAPGGAANVAVNVVSLGGAARLVGLVGEDRDAGRLESALEDWAVDPTGLVRDPDRPTTRKTRVVARNQQVVRIDREVAREPGPALRERLIDLVLFDMDGADAVILSDYAKGVLHPDVCRAALDGARERGIPIVVDPKGTDFGKYRGCSVLAPNEAEAGRAAALDIVDEASLERAAGRLHEVTEADGIVITRGPAGMAVFGHGEVRRLPAEVREVYDVTGAGDTVVATLALGLAAGLDLVEAAQLANAAAGIAVEKVGPVPVTGAELVDQAPESEP